MGACSTCCSSPISEKLEASSKVFDREKRVLEHGKTEKIDDVYKIDVGKDGVISNGTVGTIFKAQHLKNKTIRAVKQMNKKNVKGDRWQAEVNLMKRLDHPHICRLYETWEDAKFVYLIMELCRGGDLMNLAFRSEKTNESLVAVLIRQMVGATAHLHSHDIVHSDMRPENWLFDEPVQPHSSVLDLNLKMIDFGFASKFSGDEDKKAEPAPDAGDKKKKNLMHEKSGAYCKAPEQIGQKDVSAKASDKCDVWAIGVIAFLLLCGEPPFPRSAGKFKDELIRQAKFEFQPDSTWKAVTSEAKSFITTCLAKEAADRPTTKDLLDDNWMYMAKDALDEAYTMIGKAAQERASMAGAKGGRRASAAGSKISILDAPLPDAGSMMESMKKMGKMNALEKAAVTAAAHRLPSDKISYLRKTFENMDRNGDGVLSVKELAEGLKKAGIATAELTEVLEAIDTDGSGLIEYTEFIAATYHFQRTMQDDVIWSVFRIFDADGSGSVTSAELKAALIEPNSAYKQNIEDYFPDSKGKDIGTLLSELDGNGDGEIDFEEFKQLLNKPKG